MKFLKVKKIEEEEKWYLLVVVKVLKREVEEKDENLTRLRNFV